MDMKQMMKQAQRMQLELNRAQEEIKTMTYEASSGGGMVKVTARGDNTLVDVSIDASVVDPEDVEMLQDLVLAAANEALAGVNELSQARINSVTGGMKGMPGF
ncbi:MAG: YbaB/EbfC family nucleoid-associated protein [Eggerthellaceae bacterium]|nr:YbaB/EbfC family nucleoid-associated protein [Eggerthellaceae bacterium]